MSDKSNTSFIQYALCGICGIHHNLGVKHIYSKQHQRKVSEVLKKTLNKISLAKKCMKDIEVHDESWGKDNKFWCYYCSEELPKHQHSSSNLTIKGLGYINHFSSHTHYEATKKFMKQNRLSKGVEKFIIKKADMLSLLDNIPAYEKKYLSRMDVIHKKHVSNIQEIERQRSNTVQATCSEIAQNQAHSSNHINNLSTSHGNLMQNHVPTKSPQVINQLSKRIPPWLLPADATTCIATTSSEPQAQPENSAIIGPSMADFEKHILKQQKKGLNPKRVGANFDHNATNSDNWLPSFGRVWCQGRRKQSQVQFLHQKKKKKI